MSASHDYQQKTGPSNPSDRLPPGQVLTQKWPVLTHGEIPEIDLRTWRFKAGGLVEDELSWSWDQFRSLPQVEVVSDIHCVTRWSRYDNRWRGVAAKEIVDRVRPRPEARFVMVHSYGGYSANMPLEDFTAKDVIFAFTHDGKPLAREHGGPCRLVVPALYFWKSAKWVVGVEFLKENRAGFWEQYGYHMRGDPRAEERFRGR